MTRRLTPFSLLALLLACLAGCGGGDDLEYPCADTQGYEVTGQVPETRCREHRL